MSKKSFLRNTLIHLLLLLSTRQGCSSESVAENYPDIVFHLPTSGQVVTGRTFAIEVEIFGLQIPEEGKGILYLDSGKLLEVRQQHLTVNMDGAGGLSEGPHSLRVELFDTKGKSLSSGSVSFVKEGSPEELAGPFHDSRFDDEALVEVQIHSNLSPRAASNGRHQLLADARSMRQPRGATARSSSIQRGPWRRATAHHCPGHARHLLSHALRRRGAR